MGKHTPKLSVVITAHNRRKFLRAAVDSVLSQSLARSEYEVIVVKNFRDQNLDRYFAKKKRIKRLHGQRVTGRQGV